MAIEFWGVPYPPAEDVEVTSSITLEWTKMEMLTHTFPLSDSLLWVVVIPLHFDKYTKDMSGWFRVQPS